MYYTNPCFGVFSQYAGKRPESHCGVVSDKSFRILSEEKPSNKARRIKVHAPNMRFHSLASRKSGMSHPSKCFCANCDSSQSKSLRKNMDSVTLMDRRYLPYWHIVEATSNAKENKESKYNCVRAAHEWDCFYSGKSLKNKEIGGINKCMEDAINNFESAEEKYKKESDHQAMSNRWEESKENYIADYINKPLNHSCRPFYGSTEIEKCSLNVINYLIKAQKELKRLQFTAGMILPQSQKYIEQVDSMHSDLKHFNTQFRELQKQTDDLLEQKTICEDLSPQFWMNYELNS